MKKLQLTLLLCGAALYAVAQNDDITVCHTSATEKFAFFAADKSFTMSHPNPEPYVHQSEIGKMVTFKTPDGKDASGYVLMAKSKTNNWIFVFQE